MMKVCSKCHIEKDESEFYKNGKYISSYCKKCVIVKTAERHKKNKDKRKKYRRNYYNRNKPKLLLRQKKIDKTATYKRKRKEWERKNILELNDRYIKQRLTQGGYSSEQIQSLPDLLVIKKIQIINHRIKNNYETK